MCRRRALNLLALLSLLLCATLLVLGGRNQDQSVFTAGGRLYWIMVGGNLEVLTVGGWPEGERARWMTVGPFRDEPLVSIEGRGSVRQWLGVEVESTQVATKLDEQGRPVPIGRVDAEPGGLRTVADHAPRAGECADVGGGAGDGRAACGRGSAKCRANRRAPAPRATRAVPRLRLRPPRQRQRRLPRVWRADVTMCERTEAAVDPKAIILWLYLAVGGAIALLSVPFILGVVPPNPFYGLRVKKTRDDPAAWYTANRFLSWRMLAAAGLVATVAVGAYALLPGLGLAAYSLTCLAATAVGVGSAFVWTWRYVRRQ